MLKNYFINILFSIILAFSTNVHIYSTFENQKKPVVDNELYITAISICSILLTAPIAFKCLSNFNNNQRYSSLVTIGSTISCTIGGIFLVAFNESRKTDNLQLGKWNNRAGEEICNDAYNSCVITERNFSKIQNIAKAYLNDNEMSVSVKNSIIESFAQLNQNGLIHLIKSITHTYKMLSDHEAALKERLNYHDEVILDWHECIKRIATIKGSLYQIHNLIVGSDQYLIELEKANCEVEEIKIKNIDFIR